MVFGPVLVLAALILPYMRGIGVLDERYARGEIDREEYLRRR